MAGKILPKRNVRYPCSDTSDLSPEPQEKSTKWTLSRPPIQITRKSSTKTIASPPYQPPNVLPTSTPFLRSAPPFQLSQTLLSPVSKEQTTDSFKEAKSGKSADAQEHTFDNLLASVLNRDASSKLVVNRRGQPLQRRKNEADVERTRQYAGARTGLYNLSTEDCEENETFIAPPFIILQKVDYFTKQDQKRCDSETIAKSKCELFTDVLEDADEVQRLTTRVGLKGVSKRDVLEGVPSVTDEENAQKLNLRNTASTEVLQLVGSNGPSEAPGMVCCDNSTSFVSAHSRKEDYDKSDYQSKGSNVNLQVKRRFPERLKTPQVCERRSDASLRQDQGGFSERTVSQNSTSDVGLQVEQMSSRRRSNSVRKFRSTDNRGTENSDDKDKPREEKKEVAADSYTSGEKGTPEQIRESDDEKNKYPEAGQRDVDETMSPLLSKTSKRKRRKKQTVSDEGDMLATAKKQQVDEGKSQNDKILSMKQSHKSGKDMTLSHGEESRKVLDEIDLVLKTQKSHLENDYLEKSVEFLKTLGLVPSEHVSPSKGDVTNVNRPEKQSINDLEDSGEVCVCEEKGRRADDLEQEKRGRSGLAPDESRKENCSASDTKHGKDERSESSADRSRNHSSPKRNKRKAESPAGRRRKGSSSDANRESIISDDGKAKSVIDEIRNERKSGNLTDFCMNEIKDLTTVQSSSVVGTKLEQNVRTRSVAGRSRKSSRGSFSVEPIEDGEPQPSAVHDSKGQEKPGDGEENRPILTESGKKLQRVARLSDHSSKKIINKRKAPNEDCPKKGDYSKDTFGAKAYGKKILPGTTATNLTPTDASELSERPRRERRPPGDYWVPAPYIKRGQKETRDTRRPSTSTVNAVERPDKVRAQRNKRRSLPPVKNLKRRLIPPLTNSRESDFQSASQSMGTGNSNDESSSSVLVYHEDKVQLINKNSGLSSENPKVKIGPTFSLNSMSGRLIELDPGSVLGPQVDVLYHQVFIVMEGTIVVRKLSKQSGSVLNRTDLAVVPAGDSLKSYCGFLGKDSSCDSITLYSHDGSNCCSIRDERRSKNTVEDSSIN